MRGSGGARERARYGSACCVACPLADASVVLGPQGAGRPDSIAGARERARYGSACCVWRVRSRTPASCLARRVLEGRTPLQALASEHATEDYFVGPPLVASLWSFLFLRQG